MKELSIEEKAKAYDEALIVAKQWYDDSDTNKKEKYLLKGMFSELAESEDERIISVFRELAENYLFWEKFELTKEKALAWLEKQKAIDVLDEEEREFVDNVDSYRKEVDAAYQRGYDEGVKTTLEKQGEQSVSHDDIVNNYFIKEIIEAAIYWGKEAPTENGIIPKDKLNHAIDYYCSELKKQGEQNSTDEIGNYDHKEVLQNIINEQTSANKTPYPETLEKAIDLYYYSYGNGKGEFEHLSLEKFRDIVHTFVSDYGQKSAWSEEDELHIRELEGLVKRVWAIAEHENDKDTIHKMSDLSFFLKTLKPQLKQEWSEEDEKRRKKIMNILSFEGCLSNKELSDINNWLKDRYTWKPSDEQLHYLSWIANIKLGDSVVEQEVSKHLNELLEDLKKLREELL